MHRRLEKIELKQEVFKFASPAQFVIRSTRSPFEPDHQLDHHWNAKTETNRKSTIKTEHCADTVQNIKTLISMINT
jgi:hypothetical protein